MTKSKTEYKHFKSNYNSTNNINGMNKNEKKNIDINKNFILKRLQKKPNNFCIFSKDKKNISNIKNKLKKNNITNKSEYTLNKFNNLSNSTINNNSNSNFNDYNNTKNFNNSLSNSLNTINDNQTPLVQKKRLKLIKKFIYQEQKVKNQQLYINENISSNITIKVNRSKFLERVKEKKKCKTYLNQI